VHAPRQLEVKEEELSEIQDQAATASAEAVTASEEQLNVLRADLDAAAQRFEDAQRSADEVRQLADEAASKNAAAMTSLEATQANLREALSEREADIDGLNKQATHLQAAASGAMVELERAAAAAQVDREAAEVTAARLEAEAQRCEALQLEVQQTRERLLQACEEVAQEKTTASALADEAGAARVREASVAAELEMVEANCHELSEGLQTCQQELSETCQMLVENEREVSLVGRASSMGGRVRARARVSHRRNNEPAD
jgi:chromosome segregation ATPase